MGAVGRFGVLGAVEAVSVDGVSARLGGELPRALLASLLLENNRVVSRDRLVDALWDSPPSSATHAIDVYVSKLRRALSDAGCGRTIATRDAGYVAEVADDALDLGRFRALARAGRAHAADGNLEAAFAAMNDALDAWRGPALACLRDCPVIARRGELEEERLLLVEERVELGLELGLGDELAPTLRTLTRDHPERERLWRR